MDDEILVSSVPRALDSKSKLFGFELPDLLFIFANLTITNLIFGQSTLKYPLVWGSTFFILAFLYFAKRGKPDAYMQHYGEYLMRPTHFSAGAKDQKFRPRLKE